MLIFPKEVYGVDEGRYQEGDFTGADFSASLN